MRMRNEIRPQLNTAERDMMEQLLTGEALNHRQAVRLQVVLGRADGKRTSDIADVLRINPVSVSVIVRRFNSRGLDGLLKQPNHKPGKAPLNQKVINRVLKVVQTQQPKDATHWSTREIAKQVGISHTKVHQILQAHDLKPHLISRFRSSDDPAFEQKLEDIVGLYLNPPENAIVLSIDEKSQVQALERAQPILALRPGHPRTPNARLRSPWGDQLVRSAQRRFRQGNRCIRFPAPPEGVHGVPRHSRPPDLKEEGVAPDR